MDLVLAMDLGSQRTQQQETETSGAAFHR
eukprot:SAG31_NODE_36921_length_309_cov_0.733333_1_plen_28_part_10